MSEQELRSHRCCFTGHRPEKLKRSEEEIKNGLEEAILKAIHDGYTTFITGMARGVDIWAGQIVLRLRQSNPNLRLIAALPYPDCDTRLVNTFSDNLLSRDFQGRVVVTVQPFHWREIVKVLLDAGGVVKAVDEGENALRCFLPASEATDGVHQLLLED